jgi:hypothetical protein
VKSFKHLAPTALAALALMSTCYRASAQTIYRCGNSYSQTPCANGLVVQAEDPRSEAQRTAAKEALAQDKQLAQELEASRQKEEARAFAREQAQQAAQARLLAAQAKAEGTKTREAKAHKKPAGLRTAKVQEDGVFTATAGSELPGKAGTKTHRGKP